MMTGKQVNGLGGVFVNVGEDCWENGLGTRCAEIGGVLCNSAGGSK